MASKVDPDRLPIHALAEGQNIPLKAALAIIRDEITELQDAEAPGGAKPAFWFANISASLIGDGSWETLGTAGGGGMTGDASTATGRPGGLLLNVDAVVAVKIWTSFGAAGTGDEAIAVQITDAEGTAQRGIAQLLAGQQMATAVYDGWLLAGASIAAVARATAAAAVDPTSYITVSIAPV